MKCVDFYSQRFKTSYNKVFNFLGVSPLTMRPHGPLIADNKIFKVDIESITVGNISN